jgi:hypothetical protein
MARGWESKSVAVQIEDADRKAGCGTVSPLPMGEVKLRQQRAGLILQRCRILQEIEAARNPRYRRMLEETLSHLEKELTGLHGRQ